jgi:hypothetical protein
MLTNKVKKTLVNNKIEESIIIGGLLDGNSVGLFATAGQPSLMYFDNSRLDKNGLQVVVRNKSYEKGFKVIDNIFNMLNKEVGFSPQQSPFYLGRNENGYAEFSVNYIVYIEK